MRFEWDPKKAEQNYRKHGITFAEAMEVWTDSEAVQISDTKHSTTEERSLVMGRIDLVVVIVSCAFRGHKIRIISARRASRKERRLFYEKISEH